MRQVQDMRTGKTYLTALFEKYLVVLAQGNAENDRCHVLEAMNPLLAFAPLPADVEHAKGKKSSVSRAS